ncbi:hypothetical protein [Fibrobacter sp. UWEL]|uniref:hypothetical protein n=1 Tax=Fibrobacter sp. UWEL TaxID=1896209 RepID=UPI00091397A3|nr:hypothetical protein [Fibrobacter sp. UWEL]SHL54658.1 hypothetical protein SAMN05720468_1454 [Fibrobacter sp. UWEL]
MMRVVCDFSGLSNVSADKTRDLPEEFKSKSKRFFWTFDKLSDFFAVESSVFFNDYLEYLQSPDVLPNLKRYQKVFVFPFYYQKFKEKATDSINRRELYKGFADCIPEFDTKQMTGRRHSEYVEAFKKGEWPEIKNPLDFWGNLESDNIYTSIFQFIYVTSDFVRYCDESHIDFDLLGCISFSKNPAEHSNRFENVPFDVNEANIPWVIDFFFPIIQEKVSETDSYSNLWFQRTLANNITKCERSHIFQKCIAKVFLPAWNKKKKIFHERKGFTTKLSTLFKELLFRARFYGVIATPYIDLADDESTYPDAVMAKLELSHLCYENVSIFNTIKFIKKARSTFAMRLKGAPLNSDKIDENEKFFVHLKKINFLQLLETISKLKLFINNRSSLENADREELFNFLYGILNFMAGNTQNLRVFLQGNMKTLINMDVERWLIPTLLDKLMYFRFLTYGDFVEVSKLNLNIQEFINWVQEK